MEIEENENNLTVMVVDGRLKYYQKKDADKLLNQQQKEIEQLRDEMFLKDVAHKTTQNLWSKTLKENTKLKEQLKEFEEKTIITDGFNNNEVQNVLRKTKRARIFTNIKHILYKKNGAIEYENIESDLFFMKYAGETVNVYEWCGDWWICEEDNHPITTDCFELLTKKQD